MLSSKELAMVMGRVHNRPMAPRRQPTMLKLPAPPSWPKILVEPALEFAILNLDEKDLIGETAPTVQTASPPSKASFMGLPSELRRKILKEALLEPTGTVTLHTSCKDPVNKVVASPSQSTTPTILRVCKQLYTEGYPIYARNHFRFIPCAENRFLLPQLPTTSDELSFHFNPLPSLPKRHISISPLPFIAQRRSSSICGSGLHTFGVSATDPRNAHIPIFCGPFWGIARQSDAGHPWAWRSTTGYDAWLSRLEEVYENPESRHVYTYMSADTHLLTSFLENLRLHDVEVLSIGVPRDLGEWMRTTGQLRGMGMAHVQALPVCVFLANAVRAVRYLYKVNSPGKWKLHTVRLTSLGDALGDIRRCLEWLRTGTFLETSTNPGDQAFVQDFATLMFPKEKFNPSIFGFAIDDDGTEHFFFPDGSEMFGRDPDREEHFFYPDGSEMLLPGPGRDMEPARRIGWGKKKMARIREYVNAVTWELSR